MAQKRKYTQELRQAQAKGYTIVVSSGVMRHPLTKSGEWPVVYRPRHTTDAHPWLAVKHDGTANEELGIRYSGRECTVESRYLVDKIDEGYFQVLDLASDTQSGTFNGDMAYRKAELYALELNRTHRREVTGYSI